MQQYLDLAKDILLRGNYQFNERTKSGTLSVFGSQMEFDLQKGFPMVTTKRVPAKAVFHELLWFLKGETNIKYLKEHGVSIWDEWADEKGNLGRVYGAQWTDWRSPDGKSTNQIASVVDQIKKDPNSRRHLVSAWNVGELDQMALAPCHALFQFYVNNENLSCKLYQRSADWLLGVPFNIASYSTLVHMIANDLDLKPDKFIHTFGDAHIYCGTHERGEFYSSRINEFRQKLRSIGDREGYSKLSDWILENAPADRAEASGQMSDHVPFILKQFSREPRKLPELEITRKASIFDLVYEDFNLIGYDPHPKLDVEWKARKYTPLVAE